MIHPNRLQRQINRLMADPNNLAAHKANTTLAGARYRMHCLYGPAHAFRGVSIAACLRIGKVTHLRLASVYLHQAALELIEAELEAALTVPAGHEQADFPATA